jgi:peroxiredoxin
MLRRCVLAVALLSPLLALASDDALSWYEAPADLKLQMGSRLPSTSFKEADGTRWETAGFKGQPTVVAFFSAYCGPCIKEIPALNEFLEQHPQVRVVAISPDEPETSTKVKVVHGLKWPILSGAEETLKEWGVLSFPSFLLLDSEGAMISAPYGNRLTGTDELGYVTAAGISKWVEIALPEASGRH